MISELFGKSGRSLRAATIFYLLLSLVAQTTAYNINATAQEDGSVGGRPYSEAVAGSLHPITVITRQDIELSGIKRFRDFIERASFNYFGLHKALVLGSGRVTIGVNGRPVSDDFIDFDTVPISAVERIDVYRHSASTYSTGLAIAGHIEITLRKDYEGFELQTYAGMPTPEGGDSEHLSALWGRKIGEGSITVGVDFARRDEVRDADRSYTRTSYTPGGSFADAQGVSVRGNTVFMTTKDKKRIAAPLGGCDPEVYTGPLTDPPGGIPGTVCGYPYGDVAWHIYSRQNDYAFMDFSHPAGDRAEIFFEARVAAENNKLVFAPAPADFRFMPNARLRQDMISRIEGLESDNFPEDITVAHRFIGHGNRLWETDLEQYDFVLGVRGQMMEDVGYEAYVQYHRYDFVESGRTFIHGPKINAAIANGTYDIQNPLSTDPRHQAAIKDTSVLSRDGHKVDYLGTRLSLDGKVFDIMENSVRWGTSLYYSYLDNKDTQQFTDLQGRAVGPDDVLGAGLYSAITATRNHWSVSGDLLVPLGDRFEISFSGLYDGFDDVDSVFSHRIAALFRATPNLALRGSWSRGGNPPTLQQLHLEETTQYPFICDSDDPGPDCSLDQVEEVDIGGNPRLKPDETESFDAGISASLGPFSADADFFSLRLRKTPTFLDSQYIINLERSGNLSDFPGVQVIRVAGGRLDRIINPITNSGDTDVDGLSFRFGADMKTPLADFAASANWIRVTKYEKRVAGQDQPVAFARDRASLLLRASRNYLTFQWNMNAVSSFDDPNTKKTYKQWISNDIAFNWKKPFGLSWFELTGGIINIGNKGLKKAEPDEARPGYIDSILGRTLFFTAKVQI